MLAPLLPPPTKSEQDGKALCQEAMSQSFDGRSTAVHLPRIIRQLPHALGESLCLLCQDTSQDVSPRPMPPCVVGGGRRDLPPLALASRPTEDLAFSNSARSAEGNSACETWVVLMVAVLNAQYCGDSGKKTFSRHGR